MGAKVDFNAFVGKSLSWLAAILVILTGSACAARAQETFVIDTYTCAQFLADVGDRADAAKVRSLSWGPGAKWLATSGATQLVIWPFAGKDGPMGKAPKVLSPAEHRISAVAAHPKQEVCAVGYEDGMMLLTRIEDGAEVLARAPGNAPIAALAWNAAGTGLAFGTEDGEAGLIAF